MYWDYLPPSVYKSLTSVTFLYLSEEMLDVMNVQEIENPESFTGPTKERIIKASGKTAEDLSRMVYVWKQTLVVYTWLQEK